MYNSEKDPDLSANKWKKTKGVRMEYSFDLKGVRSIQAAHHCFFDQPVPHPSRNMPVHDFIYMVNGEWSIGIGAETYTLRRNEVLLLPANLAHFAVGECSPHTHTIYFHISALPQDGPYADSAPLSDTVPSPEEDSLVLPNHLLTTSHPHIRDLFERIIQTQAHDRVATAYFHTLLYELKSIHPQRSRTDLSQGIYAYIQGADKLLTNQAIADTFRVSKRSAEIAFKHAYHLTIHDFMIDSILKKALRYLEDYPHMKMSSIATALGFYDEFHFSKVFKSRIGMSPREYKKAGQMAGRMAGRPPQGS